MVSHFFRPCNLSTHIRRTRTFCHEQCDFLLFQKNMVECEVFSSDLCNCATWYIWKFGEENSVSFFPLRESCQQAACFCTEEWLCWKFNYPLHAANKDLLRLNFLKCVQKKREVVAWSTSKRNLFDGWNQIPLRNATHICCSLRRQRCD